MLDILNLPKIRKVAVIMPTLRCNITCAHCLLRCSPHIGDTATIDQLRTWTSEFIDLGFSPICLTGGEVFLYPDLIRAVSAICVEHSEPLVIQTNGFWASTLNRAQKILAKIPYITQLGFSVDKAHMKFINLQTIENGIHAAYDMGISNISLSISYQTPEESKEISIYFQNLFPELVIESWPVTPIGRAKKNPELNLSYDVYAWDFLPRSCEAQSTLTPIVYPNGDVHLCYHLIMCLEKDDPFLVGNLCENNLESLLRKIHNPIFDFILAYGGGSLGYLISEIAPELVNQEYQRTCELCYEALSRKEIIEYLNNTLTFSPFKDRIEQALTLRYEENKVPGKEKSKKIIACKGKNCFGKDIYSHLRNYLTNKLIDSGKWESASIECVDCMKACKFGPNVRISHSEDVIHHVDKCRIDEIIESI